MATIAPGEHPLSEHPLEALEPHAPIEEAQTSTGLDSRKMGIWLFIASEVIFFMALISTYLFYRGVTPRSEGLEHLNVPLAAIMTFVLLMSSFTMVSSLAAIRNGQVQQMRWWLLATALLGLFFVRSQAYEWSLLFGEGVLPWTNQFGATFFTTTGFHGTHVFIGVLWILGVLARAWRGGVTPTNNLSVEMVGLYWHFVDMVWVVLFTVIYLI